MLEMRALELAEAGSIKDVLRIYLWMADGDPSLDGGYLGGGASANAMSASGNSTPHDIGMHAP